MANKSHSTVQDALQIFGGNRLEGNTSTKTINTITGTAVGNSENGYVLVEIGGTVISDEEAGNVVKIPTSIHVEDGDSVTITTTGNGVINSPLVTDVVGGGDREQVLIKAAEAEAIAAKQQADTAKRVAENTEKMASEAKNAADAVGQHFFYDDNGIHVTTEENESNEGPNLLANSQGIMLRDGSQVLVSQTESGFTVYKNDKPIAIFGEEITLNCDEDNQVIISSDSIDFICYGDQSLHIGKTEYIDSSGQESLAFACSVGGTASSGYRSYSDSEGTSNGSSAHADSRGIATGGISHADSEGTASGQMSHADSNGTASNYYSHGDSMGESTGYASHADSWGKANGSYSHADSVGTTSKSCQVQHADSGGKTSGDRAHADSDGTASGTSSHADSFGTASGEASHASCYGTASANYSFASGSGTNANYANMAAIGRYNKTTTGKLFVVGNGTSSTDTSDAFMVGTSGETYAKGTISTDAGISATNGTISGKTLSASSSISSSGTISASGNITSSGKILDAVTKKDATRNTSTTRGGWCSYTKTGHVVYVLCYLQPSAACGTYSAINTLFSGLPKPYGEAQRGLLTIDGSTGNAFAQVLTDGTLGLQTRATATTTSSTLYGSFVYISSE